MAMETLSDAAARLVAKLDERLRTKERRKRLGMDSPEEPVFIPKKEANDNTLIERPRFSGGAWRTRKGEIG